ncbi:MAG: hypothetical protein U0414_16260 [Polyangiaceae bacterium]
MKRGQAVELAAEQLAGRARQRLEERGPRGGVDADDVRDEHAREQRERQ